LLPAGKVQLKVNGDQGLVGVNAGVTNRVTAEAERQLHNPPVSMLKLSKKQVLDFPSFSK
jgi:hypothetical protein